MAMFCGAAAMNEFLEQFLVEARELVEQATADLLALEREPARPREPGRLVPRLSHAQRGRRHRRFRRDGARDARRRGCSVDGSQGRSAGHRGPDRRLPEPASTRSFNGSMRSRRAASFRAKPTRRRTVSRPALLAGEAAIEAAKAETPAVADGGSSLLTPRCRSAEQIALLAVRGEGLEGRIASAGRVAANVFRHLGHADERRADRRCLGGEPRQPRCEQARARHRNGDRRFGGASGAGSDRGRRRSAPILFPARCASTPNAWTRSWASPEK